MVAGQLLLKTSDGPVTADLVTGNSYFRQAGVEHNVINNNDYELVFVEVEIKQTHHNSLVAQCLKFSPLCGLDIRIRYFIQRVWVPPS